MSERNSGEVILAFLLGSVVGACIGILFAPAPGKDTRKKLKDMMEDIGEKTEGAFEEGKEKVEEIISDAKDRFAHRKKETV
jgi:gas vesicle protein